MHLHIVRGDTSAATLSRAGVSVSDLLILHDSLSWGPCSEADHDAVRNSFWSGELQFPTLADARSLAAAIHDGRTKYVLWPEAFLDSALGIAWAVHVLTKPNPGRTDILLPTAFDKEALFLDSEAGKQSMAADLRSISREEVKACAQIWSAHLRGELDDLAKDLAKGEGRVPPWLSIEAATMRYPFGSNGVPPFVEQLLRPLTEQSSISVARLVGRFIAEGANSASYIDASSVLFSIVEDLDGKLGIIRLDRQPGAEYPARCEASLTELGRAVLSGDKATDSRQISALRWWGGRDLRAS